MVCVDLTSRGNRKEYMKKNQEKILRQKKIIQIVNDRKKISTKELSIILNVSIMTIRRDLDSLENNNLIKRIHGYAITTNYINKNVRNNEEYYIKQSYDKKLTEKKERIARYAASLINEDDCIFIDNGTTTECLTLFFPRDKNFTSLCNNISLLQGTLDYTNISLVIPGGYYNRDDESFSSDQAESFIRTFRANKVFLSASGIHKKLGITCINKHSTINKRAFIESAEERILLVDSTKFGVVTANHFAELSDIDIIITDDGISDEWIKFIQEMGVTLQVV